MERKLKAAIDAVSVVSFDVYDTAVLRAVASPQAVFLSLEREARDLFNDQALPFFARRLEAERLSREDARRTRHNGEVTLSEIYAHLGRLLGHDEPSLIEALRKLMAREIELERLLARPNPTIMEAYRYAVENGKQVVFTSDMYLPYEVLRDILSAAGYHPQDHRLFLSNLEGAGKKDGGLYKILCTVLGLAPNKILHIGDHPLSDVKNAKANGLQVFPYERCALVAARAAGTDAAEREHFDEVRALWRGLADGTCYHRRPYDEARQEETFALRLGYETLGVCALGFAQWLLAKARERNLTHLYLLPNIASLLSPVCRELCQGRAMAPQVHELYLWPAGIERARARHQAYFTEKGAANPARDTLWRHLEESGFRKATRIGLVDLGFGGAVSAAQAANFLQPLLASESKNPQIDCYSLAHFGGETSAFAVRGFLLDRGLPLRSASALQTALPLLAYFMSAWRGELSGLRDDEKGVEALFTPSPWPEQQALLQEIQEAALRFVGDLRPIGTGLPGCPAVSRELAGEALLKLFEQPSGLEAVRLGDLRLSPNGLHPEAAQPLASLPPFKDLVRPRQIRASYDAAIWKAGWKARVLSLTQWWPQSLRRRLMPWLGND